MKVKDFKYNGHRNSYTELNEVYFWTITINQWKHLVKPDENKMIIINSLQWLVQKKLVKIYGFVIMPNHIHLLWEQLAMNGKEFPKNSFEKFTAKTFIEKMKANSDIALKDYKVKAVDRSYNIWLRDPLAIRVISRAMAAQKLDYMQLNPMQPHCLLCSRPADNRFSSAKLYDQNIDEFMMLTHFGEVF